ncbi:NnrS family protein [Marinobacter oulmenensis]|uniref:Uncharacterized protein involved in response to NO n=1 Tax=Marinobacter oulmenensis TaxID=643747 RepID=A0A840UA21_9GAMM|nr:uncharacterized protein involved in response to NO [Marinobacter oulmenensis]
MPAPKKLHAFWLFFPAATLWAALVVPLSLLAVLSGHGWPPGLMANGHGHELIFGFALALVAGYTLGPQPRRVLLPLFSLWLAARLCWLLAPDSLAATVLSPLFALLLARHVVPRFQAAKKWRNRVAGPLILALCLFAVAFGLSRAGIPLPAPRTLMFSAIIGLLLLMAFIGGRMIAPAVAGTLEKQGISLKARVQPRIEGSLLVLLSIAMIMMMAPFLAPVAGLTLITAAVLLALRVMRWKLWHCRQRPDLLVLAVGYLWLAAGAAATGTHLLAGAGVLPALHLITVGALGTLSCSVILRQAWQRAERRAPPGWQVTAVALAMLVAATARYLAGPAPFSSPGLLWLAAIGWSLCYLGVTWQVITLFIADRQRRARTPATAG